MADETCWTLIRAVHGGDRGAREQFVGRYLEPVRAYLHARWRNGPLAADREDAVQEVFVRCFSTHGPLDRLDRLEGDGFRAYLYGVCRNVAREAEERHRRREPQHGSALERVEAEESRLSTAFDRAFARQVMREARELFRERASAGDDAARRRSELLTMRFEDGLPIRDIAARWNEPAPRVHKEYARARREFHAALLDVVAQQSPGASAADVERAAKRLLELLA